MEGSLEQEESFFLEGRQQEKLLGVNSGVRDCLPKVARITGRMKSLPCFTVFAMCREGVTWIYKETICWHTLLPWHKSKT